MKIIIQTIVTLFILSALLTLCSCGSDAENRAYHENQARQNARVITYVVIDRQEPQKGWNSVPPRTSILIIKGGDNANELKLVRGLWGNIGDTIITNVGWFRDNECYMSH